MRDRSYGDAIQIYFKLPKAKKHVWFAHQKKCKGQQIAITADSSSSYKDPTKADTGEEAWTTIKHEPSSGQLGTYNWRHSYVFSRLESKPTQAPEEQTNC